MRFGRKRKEAKFNQGGQDTSASMSPYIATIQRIVGEHHNHLRMPLETVRFVLEKALHEKGSAVESQDDIRMGEQLERNTGLSLAEIVELSKRWPT